MKKLILFFASFLSLQVFAQSPAFINIDQNDLRLIGREFASNFAHHSVTHPEALGDVWGIEVGLTGGATTTPQIDRFVREADPTSVAEGLPHAAILVAVTIPNSITGEVRFIPSVELSDVDLSTFSLGLKWTLSDNYLKGLPLDVAIRAHYSSSDLSFTQTISSVTTNVEFNTSVLGAHVLAGGSFLFFEPYLGFGFAKADVEAGVSGSSTIFDTSFTTSTVAETDDSSSHFLAGVQFDMFFINLGLEYAKLFETESFTAKFSLAF